VVDKLRQFHDHPGFVEPHADAVRDALSTLDPSRRASTRLVFTAHSIPLSMARSAGPTGGRYEAQLRETAGLVARAVAQAEQGATAVAQAEQGATAVAPDLRWDLVWQSRSGPPHVPWLEPDINDHLETLAKAGVTDVVVSPIGFVSDHLEVVWDLDTEAAATAQRLGLGYARAGTPGTDPRFVTMVRELVAERTKPFLPAHPPPLKRPGTVPQRKLGTLPVWDACPSDCCAVKART
jgi:ferrochelatase